MNRDRLINQLIADEGLKPYAYQDSLGFWTIGIGTLIDRRKNGGLTIDECRYLANNRLDRIKGDLDDQAPWWKSLVDARQEAIMNMAYNLGVSGVLGFKKMIEAIRVADWQQAAAEMRASKWADQVGARAQRLARMMETGEA